MLDYLGKHASAKNNSQTTTPVASSIDPTQPDYSLLVKGLEITIPADYKGLPGRNNTSTGKAQNRMSAAQCSYFGALVYVNGLCYGIYGKTTMYNTSVVYAACIDINSSTSALVHFIDALQPANSYSNNSTSAGVINAASFKVGGAPNLRSQSWFVLNGGWWADSVGAGSIRVNPSVPNYLMFGQDMYQQAILLLYNNNSYINALNLIRCY